MALEALRLDKEGDDDGGDHEPDDETWEAIPDLCKGRFFTGLLLLQAQVARGRAGKLANPNQDILCHLDQGSGVQSSLPSKNFFRGDEQPRYLSMTPPSQAPAILPGRPIHLASGGITTIRMTAPIISHAKT